MSEVKAAENKPPTYSTGSDRMTYRRHISAGRIRRGYRITENTQQLDLLESELFMKEKAVSKQLFVFLYYFSLTLITAQLRTIALIQQNMQPSCLIVPYLSADDVCSFSLCELHPPPSTSHVILHWYVLHFVCTCYCISPPTALCVYLNLSLAVV